MVKKTISVSLLIGTISVLAGCEGFGAKPMIRNHRYDYKESQSVSTLKLPPDVQLAHQQEFYPIPAVADDVTETHENGNLAYEDREFYRQLPPDSRLAKHSVNADYIGKVVPVKEVGYTLPTLIKHAKQQHPSVDQAQETEAVLEEKTKLTQNAKPSTRVSDINISRIGTNTGYVTNYNPQDHEQHVLLIKNTEEKVFAGLQNGLRESGFHVLIPDPEAQMYYFVNPTDTGGRIVKETPIYQLHLVQELVADKPATIVFLTDNEGKALPPQRTKRLLSYLNKGLIGKRDFSLTRMINGVLNGETI